MKNFDKKEANTYKKAFELTYKMMELRPYYLESEFALETPAGHAYVTQAAKIRYNITGNWEFPTSLRTRDRMMWMKACTIMYKATGEKKYMKKAKELAAQIADRQYTDKVNAIDGCYGMFKEFDNCETAFMVEFLQSFGQNIGAIQPTDLEPFIDLIEYDPDDPDADRWRTVIQTFVDGFIKNSSKLTPLGIYPVCAYPGEGVKFFQSIPHGATVMYGLSARNMAILGKYLNDTTLRDLAQRNLQFVIGLNPGFPNQYKETKWQIYILLSNDAFWF